MRHLRYYPLFAALLPYACQSDFALPEATSSGFVVVGTANSGLEFNNLITESDSFNYFTYPYLFLGAGVAAGDFDGDGATDLFFTGNQVANRLYRNLGNLQFEDVTEVAGVAAPNNWCTGVTTLDVNTDGHLDLYVATAGAGAPTANLLYVNQGDGTFVEQAAAYVLAEKNHSIQATAFDFDLDGDQDLFVANYANVPVSQGNEFYDRKMRENNPAESGQLYRNNGDGTFTNHTDAAGLRRFGLTLGLIATDFNADGHTDLYLSNDFNVPDYFFLNQGDGTFREALASSFPHTAMFGMGIDAGDINNDGHPDLIQLDMTPADYRKAKTNMASMRPASFYRAVSLGFHYQYMQNALQLHRGVDVNGTPHFTDISRFSGTATTDWSWGALLEDLDNDGFQDLFVTNGMKRDVNDNDVNASYNEGNFFSDNKSRDYRLLPSHPVGNFAFRNQGDLLMEDVSERWRANQAGFSQGFIAADLDGDVFEDGFLLFGGEFVGGSPAWEAGGGAELGVEGEVVDFDDGAVGGVGEGMTVFVEFLDGGDEFVEGGGVFVPGGGAETAGGEELVEG
ncbi:MAG: VCBS repeat-containing protein [Bacteroidota bacterium]